MIEERHPHPTGLAADCAGLTNAWAYRARGQRVGTLRNSRSYRPRNQVDRRF